MYTRSKNSASSFGSYVDGTITYWPGGNRKRPVIYNGTYHIHVRCIELCSGFQSQRKRSKQINSSNFQIRSAQFCITNVTCTLHGFYTNSFPFDTDISVQPHSSSFVNYSSTNQQDHILKNDAMSEVNLIFTSRKLMNAALRAHDLWLAK